MDSLVLSVIVPCFNEQDVIEQTYIKLKAVLDDIRKNQTIEYELSYRGEPAIDVGDVIGQGNKYDANLKTIVEESQLKFDGTISGALITRRKESVDRT